MRILFFVAALLLLGLTGYWMLSQEVSPATSGSAPAATPDRGSAAAPAAGGQSEVLAPLGEVEREVALAAEAAQLGTGGAAASGQREVAVETILSGRVVDQRGLPIAEAELRLQQNFGLYFLVAEGDRAQLEIAGQSDSEGNFRLTTKLRGQVSVHVEADRYAPFEHTTFLHGRGEQSLGELTLQRGVVLAGHVYDHQGRAVMGAELVRPAQRQGDLVILGMEEAGPVVATTDESGYFEIQRMAVGPFRLLVRSKLHPDGVCAGETSVPEEVRRDLVVRLEEGTSIRGVARNLPAGEVLSVRASAQNPGEHVAQISGITAGGAPRMAELSADGSFVVSGLRLGQEYRLSLTAAGSFNRRTRSASVSAMAGASGVELIYTRGTTLSLQAVDQKTGLPVTAFEVSAGVEWTEPLLDASNQVLRQHPNGFVRYEGLRPRGAARSLTLEIDAVGYEHYRQSGITIAHEGEVDLGKIALVPMAVVRVNVRSQKSGEPIAEASVHVSRVQPQQPGMRGIRINAGSAEAGPAFSAEQEDGETDALGQAVLRSMPGEHVQIVVLKEGYAKVTTEEFVLPTEGDYEREVLLSRGGGVRVLVLDDAGQAVPAMGISHREEGSAVPLAFAGAPVADATANEEGVAYFDNLAPGRHLFQLIERKASNAMAFVSMQVSGDNDDSGWSEAFVVDGEVSELVLYARSRGRLAGQVLEGGLPLSGARVALREKEASASMPVLPGFMGNEGAQAVSDAEGRFTFEDQPAGDYEISVDHDSRALEQLFPVRLEGGDNFIELALSSSVVEGTVRDENGKPLAGAKVAIQRVQQGAQRVMIVARMATGAGGDDEPLTMLAGAGGDRRVSTDAEGHFVLRGVPNGSKLQLTASHPEKQNARSGQFEVAENEVLRDQDLKLLDAGKLRVYCRRADGSAAPNALLRAEFAGESPSTIEPVIQATNSEGLSKFNGLRPGPWNISLMRESIGSEESTQPPQLVEIVAGEEAETSFSIGT